MKRAIVLVFAFAVSGVSTLRAAVSNAFGIHVIDDATGRGVPMVTLETNNRISLVTDSAGWAAFDEPGLMGRSVFFAVRSPGYACAENHAGVPGVTLETKAGGTAEVKVMRLGIAERAYRVTGQGIYREATRLGLEVPLPRPNMNGRFISHGREQAAVVGTSILWFWNEVQGAGTDHGERLGAAISELPEKGGLDASLGVHFEYLEGRRLFKSEGVGRVEIEGAVPVKAADGTTWIMGHYSRFRADGAREEHGIAEFNQTSHCFEPMTSLGEEFSWQCPRGQAVRVKAAEGDLVYFADPFCRSRVKASYEAILDPSQYEALTYDKVSGQYVWQKQASPVAADEEQHLVEQNVIAPDKARLRLRSTKDGSDVKVHSSTIAWSPFRNAWLMIAAEQKAGAGAAAGRIWCAEADSPDGPWTAARIVVDHEPLSLADPLRLEAFDQEGGKIIYFGATVAGGLPASQSLPRYDGNRLMFRLDLSNPRFGPHGR